MMRVRNNTFLLMLVMMISSLSFSQDILPSLLRDKVYIFFSDEVNPKTKNPLDHKKEQRYLVTYTEDEYFMVHLGTDNLYQGNYEYNMRKGYHNIPWGIVAHNTHMNDEHDMFHLVMIPHDSMSGMFIVLGYNSKSEEPTGGSSGSGMGMGMGMGMKKGESIDISAPEAIPTAPKTDMPDPKKMGVKGSDASVGSDASEGSVGSDASEGSVGSDGSDKDKGGMDCKDCQDHMNCKECKEHMNCSDPANCKDHMDCKGCNDHMKCKEHMTCDVHMDCKDHMKCMPAIPLGPSKPTGSSSKDMMKKNFFMHSGTYKRIF